MMFTLRKILLIPVIQLIAGCASLPNGPNVMALPGTGRSFEQFRQDDMQCEQYAYAQVGGATPNQSAVTPNREPATGSREEVQERYDVAYVQCMYAKGHQVPVSGPFSDVIPHATQQSTMAVPQPPPPGAPPPPTKANSVNRQNK